MAQSTVAHKKSGRLRPFPAVRAARTGRRAAGLRDVRAGPGCAVGERWEMRDRNDLILRDEPLYPQQPLMQYQPVPPGLYPAPAPAGPGQNDLDLFRGIIRHAWLVVIFMLIGLAGAWLYLKSVTPQCRAIAKIYI